MSFTRHSHAQHLLYRSIVGFISYLSVSTRLDLSFPVSVLSRKLHNPTNKHLQMAQLVMRYLSGTVKYSLHYGRSFAPRPHELVFCVDADWGGVLDTRRSTTGSIIAVNSTPVYWPIKRQTVISLSSVEAQYVHFFQCQRRYMDTETNVGIFELFHVYHQRTEINLPTYTFRDSTVALSLSTKPQQASVRTKHIDLQVHHVCELVAAAVVSVSYVRSDQQPADILTKPSTREGLERFISAMNVSITRHFRTLSTNIISYEDISISGFIRCRCSHIS